MEGGDELPALGAWSVDQADLEQDIAAQASRDIAAQEQEAEQKRLDKTRAKLKDLHARIALLNSKISDPRTRITQREKFRDDIYELQRTDIKNLERDEQEILARMADHDGPMNPAPAESGAQRQADESEREFLIRTGKITPFERIDADNLKDEVGRSHRDLAGPNVMLERSVKRAKVEESSHQERIDETELDDRLEIASVDSGSETDEDEPTLIHEIDEGHLDDGDPRIYERRLKHWVHSRSLLRSQKQEISKSKGDLEEWQKPSPGYADAVIDEEANFRIPGDIWSSLFAYQKVGVRWLWELYSQKAGGIIGDEMGLGKTVQVAAFLAGLHYSGKLQRPALVVCPATVLRQWVTELHQWWPPMRVAILHSIGTGMGGNESLSTLNDDDDEDENYIKGMRKTQKSAQRLVQDMFKTGHIVLTTYAGLRIYSRLLVPKLWGYCCLDEGHKIRNPNADVSLAAKQIRTPYRVILSGTPIQNNLTELWSLFDFVFPGRLGTLPVFQNEFSIPINVGGYANASNIQVQTAYKCAVVLRNSISPYLLRRMKSDVASDLPKKTEKVLFSKMTKSQHAAYSRFLASDEMQSIISGRRQVLYGIDILRKICNHPDLLLLDKSGKLSSVSNRLHDYGDPSRSGKMQVIKALLELWKPQGHRALLFTQTRQMLDILEKFVSHSGYKYLRMDGATPIGKRQDLVDTFNQDSSYGVFLLTTKVGGLGINLTGADRVIIFDPDWNPSTDAQARERAWRLGQKNEVMVYRLMVAGSIEEKIYHRQIFKQFLTNKILKDPKQKRFFKTSDIHDLFSLGDGTESSSLFGGDNSGHQGQDNIDDLDGVSKQDNYQVKEDTPKSGDEGVLEGIFAKAGVQSTLEHDLVMGVSRPDTVLMEREAARVAQQAAEALKASRREARKHKIGTPTWTGQFGAAGKTGENDKRASSSILSNLRAKRELESKSTSKVAIPEPRLKSLTSQLDRITKFMADQPTYSAVSGDIVKNANIILKSDQDVANLRKMLKQIADWDKLDKRWVLKEEFR